MEGQGGSIIETPDHTLDVAVSESESGHTGFAVCEGRTTTADELQLEAKAGCGVHIIFYPRARSGRSDTTVYERLSKAI